MSEPLHVDDFIWGGYGQHKYARWVLMLMRLPAAPRMDWHEWADQYKLFATYGGKRYRVTGASRLGDVWLSANFERETGYELRVNVEACSDWGDKP